MSKPVFSFEAFRDFCKSKNPNEEYDYSDPGICACAQYAATIGMTFYEGMARSSNFNIFNDLAGDKLSRHFDFEDDEKTHCFFFNSYGNFGDLTKKLENYIESHEFDDLEGQVYHYDSYDSSDIEITVTPNSGWIIPIPDSDFDAVIKAAFNRVEKEELENV